MKLQTERLENHKAQFTIEIEADQLEDAKLRAARSISRRVRIKGFRKGKAPYRLVAQYVGESAILEEAVETLGDTLYKQALDESEVLPYAPGAFEDFKLEPVPTFIFSVPLQPEVDLKGYSEVRLDFEVPTVSAEEIDEILNQLQMRDLEVIDDDVEVTAAGNRVIIDVESVFADGEPADEVTDNELAEVAEDALISEGDGEPADEVTDNKLAEAAEDALSSEGDVDQSQTEDDESPPIPKQGDTFVNDQDRQIILDPNQDPFMHGFVENLLEVERGSDVEFELTIPDDDLDTTIVGRRVSFLVTVKKIEEIAIPDLDDEFARQVSRSRGDEELDLAGLREATREELESSALQNAEAQYSSEVLQQIVENAEIHYPELMLDEHINEMIREFEQNLSQQNMKLEDYLRLTNSSADELRKQYRERATQSLRQTLVLREFVSAQAIDISDNQFEQHLDSLVAGYGMNEELRPVFNSEPMSSNIRNNLMMTYVNAHLLALGQGQDPADAVAEVDARRKAEMQRLQERRQRREQYETEAAADDAQDAAAEDAEAAVVPDMPPTADTQDPEVEAGKA